MTLQKLSIVDCNTGWFAVEESGPFNAETRFEIGACLRQIDDRHRFIPASRSAAIEYYQLEDVIFDGQTGAVFKDSEHIAETRYSTPDGYTFAIDRTRLISIEDARTVFLASHAWHTNYFHWITQCVPAIYWGYTISDHAKTVFALPMLCDWQEEALSLANLGCIERYAIDEHHQYEAGRLAYTTLTQGATTYRPSRASREVFEVMRSRAAGTRGGIDELIYVSREDAINRRMTNELELCDRLRKEGVRIVVPGQHTVAEQIAIFAGARVVIGPHGAGLTNIVFCQEGATLYEIMPGRSPNPCYSNLAQAQRMHYRAEAFSCPAEDSDEDAWTVDVGQVLQSTRELIGL